MKIIVTAGGTGGHIYPALGVIEKILEDKNNEVLYIGTTNRMESTLIPEKNIPYIGLEIYGLSKTDIKRNIKNISCIKKSYKKCKKIMKEYKPDYVIGFGGYVTFPVLMASHKYKIRNGIHEQNKIPGKTNKILSKFVDTTFISFKESKSSFKNNVILSGNPCGEKAINIKKHDKTKLGLSKNKKLILIVMGSLGSSIVNDKIKDFLLNFNSDIYEILFITGNANYDKYKNIKFNKSIKVIPYYNDLSGLMKSSDLIISRSGASSISEILSLNKLSILIPSPYVSNNHQYYNALTLKEKNLALMLEQKDLNKENLNNIINEAFSKEKEIINNLKQEPKLNASTIITKEILKKKV